MIGDSVYPDTMGGSHRHIYDLSTNLSKRGYIVTVYSPKQSKTSTNYEVINGFTIKRYKHHKGKVHSFIDFIIQPYKLFISENKCHLDIIHGHWPLTCYLIFKYIRLKKLPIRLIYTFHGPTCREYSYELKENFIIKKVFLSIVKHIENSVLKNCDSIQVASSYMKNEEISLYGNMNKIKQFPHAIDLEKFHLFPKNELYIFKNKYGFIENNKYIFTLRRLKKRMGIDVLLEAFAIVVNKYPSYHLLIGGKGDYIDILKNKARKLNIEKNVCFLGFIQDDIVPLYYAACDVCVVPSLDLEGFGLTTAEAMACGTPVIATKVCANIEILSGITPDFLVDIDKHQMADMIIKVIDIKDDLSKRLNQYVKSNYNWENFIIKIIQMYNS